MNKSIFSLICVVGLCFGQVLGETVCYYNGTLCAGEGVCRTAPVNTGICALAAEDTYGTFSKSGSEYTLSFFVEPTCEPPAVLFLTMEEGACLPVSAAGNAGAPNLSIRITVQGADTDTDTGTGATVTTTSSTTSSTTSIDTTTSNSFITNYPTTSPAPVIPEDNSSSATRSSTPITLCMFATLVTIALLIIL